MIIIPDPTYNWQFMIDNSFQASFQSNGEKDELVALFTVCDGWPTSGVTSMNSQ